MLKKAALALTAIAAVAVGAYIAGVRPMGTPLPPQFRQEPDAHYAALAKQREAQQAQGGPAATTAAVRPSAPAVSDAARSGAVTTIGKTDRLPAEPYWENCVRCARRTAFRCGAHTSCRTPARPTSNGAWPPLRSSSATWSSSRPADVRDARCWHTTAVSGRQIWAALDDKASYAAPQLATIHGVRQVLIFSASRLAGLRPEDGTLLWDFPWRGGGGAGINVAQPIVLGDRVFVSTGYGVGSAMVQVAREASSTSLRAGWTWSVRELWRTSRMKNQFTSSVHHDGFIYGLDEGILACIDAGTGERRWKAGRYGDGQVLLASAHLIVSTDMGDLVLVRATPKGHEEVARSPALNGRTWNHPAIADGMLLVRNSNEMAAFDLSRR